MVVSGAKLCGVGVVPHQIQEDPLRHNLLQEFTATLQESRHATGDDQV